MDVIPVIDVQHGQAVRAERGARAGYQPLKTPLAEGSDPVAVALGLRALFPFPVLYVADLDGIEGRGRDTALPGRLSAALPGVGLWIDDGTPARGALARSPSGATAMPVQGSEGLRSADDVAALRALPPDRYVLSLDFKDDRFDGPPHVLAEVLYWPRRVIVMTLARVGSGEGPDLGKIAGIVARAGRRDVYAAGGVRNARRRRSGARGRGGGRACRQRAARWSNYGRRSFEDRRPVMSCEEVEQSGVSGLYPFHRPVSSLPNRCSRPPFIGGVSSCCGRFPLQVFAPNGC